MNLRLPKDEPWPGGRGVYDWRRRQFVRVTARESAGVALDRKAHDEIVPRRGGSTAAACAKYGSPVRHNKKERTS